MPEATPLPPGRVRRLFILRPDNLGDVVLFTGALRHLRRLYAGARITLCVRRYVGPLVEHCPYVDEVVFWEDLHATWPEWTRRVRGLSRLELAIRRRQIRTRHRCDVALLPVRSPNTEMHGTLLDLPARERYGIAGCHSNQLSATDRSVGSAYTRRLELDAEREWAHEIQVTREFLALLGAEVTPGELLPEFWTGPEDVAWADDHAVPEPGTLLLALAPGVTAPAGKAYPAERYAEVLAGLGERRATVMLLGGAADTTICAEAERAIAGVAGVAGVTNLAGRTSVPQMVECLRRADLVLGPDAAAMHVAIALGRPTLTILGGGQYGRFHPWGDATRNRVVIRRMSCFGCDWRCIYDTIRCVQEIEPAAVAQALGDLLAAAFPPTLGRT